MIILALSLALSAGQSPDPTAILRLHRGADERLVAGDAAKARELFAAALELAPRNPTLAYGRACAEARAGDVEAAFDWLARAAEFGYRDAAVAEWDEDLATLRKDARFAAIVEKLRGGGEAPTRLPVVCKVYDERAHDGYCLAAVSRDGASVAVAANDHDTEMGVVLLLDPASGHATKRLASFESQVCALAFRPDGRRLGVLTWDGRFHLLPIGGAEAPATVAALADPHEKLGWPFGALVAPSPDGERWLVAARERGARLLDADGALVHAWYRPTGNYFDVAMAWNCDGTRIGAVLEGRVHFFDGHTGAEVGDPLTSRSEVNTLAFHPSRDLLATADEDSHARMWGLTIRVSLVDDEQKDIFPTSVDAVSFSPDGRRLAYSTAPGAFVVVLDLEKGSRIYTSEHLGGRMGEPVKMTWSPDSTRLWHAFESAVMTLTEVDFSGAAPVATTLMRSGPPVVGTTGVAVSVHYSGMLGIDSRTGAVRWVRANVGERGELLYTPTGYFTCDFDDLDGLRLQTDVHGAKPPLALDAHVAELFDPKRVRAVRQGVRLLPPRL